MARHYVNPNRYGDQDPAGEAMRAIEREQWVREDRARRGPATMPALPRQTTSISSIREPAMYRPDKDTRNGNAPGTMFLKDVLRSHTARDRDAMERLARHMQEQIDGPKGPYLQRAAGSSNFSGLLVPQWLVDLYSPAVAALRPFADIFNRRPLPAEGMSLTLGQVATGSSAAVQGAENTALSSTSPNMTLLTEQVQSAGGSVQVSRQALERGEVDAMLAEDLVRAYSSALDSTLLNQASTGAVALATAVTLTGASTQAQVLGKILAAASSVETHLLGQASPSHVVLTPARWWWMNEAGTSWPLITAPSPAAPFSGGVEHPGDDYRKGPRGVVPGGLLAVADQNLPSNQGVSANQDTILVVADRECILFELPGDGDPVQVGGSPGPAAGGPMLFIRAEQVSAAQLGVTLSVWSYFAFCLRRFSGAIAAVSGTGLTTPQF